MGEVAHKVGRRGHFPSQSCPVGMPALPEGEPRDAAKIPSDACFANCLPRLSFPGGSAQKNRAGASPHPAIFSLYRTVRAQWCQMTAGLSGSYRLPGHPGLLEVALQHALLVLASFISFASMQKHESSVIPLLVLSKSNPLRWALIWYWLT